MEGLEKVHEEVLWPTVELRFERWPGWQDIDAISRTAPVRYVLQQKVLVARSYVEPGGRLRHVQAYEWRDVPVVDAVPAAAAADAPYARFVPQSEIPKGDPANPPPWEKSGEPASPVGEERRAGEDAP